MEGSEKQSDWTFLKNHYREMSDEALAIVHSEMMGLGGGGWWEEVARLEI